jgi:phosphosulfolactate synthase (CoM biosynthesis protein A)
MATRDTGRAFPFLRVNERGTKPRARGVTEIRGAYYTPLGKGYLHDVLETVGTYIDGLKFGGGSFVLYPRTVLTENVSAWRTDAVARFVAELGTERVMFEAADSAVFTWYVKNYGPDVNLFVDHSQIVQLECLRSGVWGTTDVWGRVVTFKG